jgi:thiol:disulfide interchange protein DsbD
MNSDDLRRQTRAVSVLCLVQALFLLTGASAAPAAKARFSAVVAPAQVRRGETVELRLHVEVDDGWHVYAPTSDPDGGVPTAVALKKGAPFETAGRLAGPTPEKHAVEGLDLEVEYYPGDVDLLLPVRVAKEAALGQTEVHATVKYMACSDTSCTPPVEAELSAAVEVVAGEARPEYLKTGANSKAPLAAVPPTAAPDELAQAIEKGFWSFAWLAITMGLLALLTPCVFPMIPITVSFFTAQGERTRSQAVGMAATYALGIVFTYTVLGLLLALTLGATGANRLASSAAFNLFVSVLFIVFALSMFGLFELRLPSSFVQFSSQQQSRGGFLGVLFMSLTFALVSFSCTVQFVGLLLVAASQGEWTWPVLGMALFSSALALPFFFLALFPRFLQSLPKSGEWMESVKVVMGFLLVAAATKFLSNVDALWGWHLLTRPAVLAVWVCSFGLAGLYLLGKIRLAGHGESQGVGPARLMLSLLFLTFALYLSAGLAGQPLAGLLNAYLPASEGPAVATGGTADARQWFDSYEQALAESKRTGKPVFVDFGGKTCTNCRWMEANLLPRPEVSALLDRFVPARLMTDIGPYAKQNGELQVRRFGTTALPFYAIMDSEDREVGRFPGLTKDAGAFARFLSAGLDEAKRGAGSGE